MRDYNKYIDRLKGLRVKRDDHKLHAQIEARIHRRPAAVKLAFGGVLAVLLVGLALYYYSPLFFPGKGVTVAEYVFQRESLNGDQIMNYVLMD